MPEIVELEEEEQVMVGELREGERVRLEYESAQSGNWVKHDCVVEYADTRGQNTNEVTLLGDNDICYHVGTYGKVESVGANSRQLSEGRPNLYLLEALEVDEYEEEKSFGALTVRREKAELFACPTCHTSESTSVIAVNDDNVVISCGQCRNVLTVEDQPTIISLKIQR